MRLRKREELPKFAGGRKSSGEGETGKKEGEGEREEIAHVEGPY